MKEVELLTFNLNENWYDYGLFIGDGGDTTIPYTSQRQWCENPIASAWFVFVSFNTSIVPSMKE